VVNIDHDAKGVDFGGHANFAIEHFRKAQAELTAADQYNDSTRQDRKRE
jgi:hypothetical protein